ncbi:MAG: gamma-glutamyl-gamma-aminobutyrate hydrolase family protein [Anaerolineales bacterium]|jgi:putative glutamine amidotransferase
MQPVIGITTFEGKNPDGLPTITLLHAYVYAILEAGGVPVLIPSMLAKGGWNVLYERLDGVVFSGGGDIAPEYFNGEENPRIDGVDPLRDTVELSLLRAVVDDGKPFLGICRGIQTVNVGLGGTLYEHLGEQFQRGIDHTYPSTMRTHLVHEVKIEEGTRIADVVGEPVLRVNSLHHQGLREIAPGLDVSGYAPDGLVEAVELPDHPFGLAVQWHPEWLTDQQSTRNLFKAFVDAARK